MKVELSAEEVRRAIARAAVEKVNAAGQVAYHWGEHVEVFGLSGESGVWADLRDGQDHYVALARSSGFLACVKTVADGERHRLVLTRDENGAEKIYVDGKEVEP